MFDDEEAVRTPLRIALEMAGHEVREAADGASGLALQQETPADLVITDLRMPGLGPDEIVAKLRTGYPTTKIIAISALDRDLAVRLDVDCAIQKPFSLKDVLEKVSDLLAE